jgi:hypothetical protein
MRVLLIAPTMMAISARSEPAIMTYVIMQLR